MGRKVFCICIKWPVSVIFFLSLKGIVYHACATRSFSLSFRFPSCDDFVSQDYCDEWIISGYFKLPIKTAFFKWFCGANFVFISSFFWDSIFHNILVPHFFFPQWVYWEFLLLFRSSSTIKFSLTLVMFQKLYYIDFTLISYTLLKKPLPFACYSGTSIQLITPKKSTSIPLITD